MRADVSVNIHSGKLQSTDSPLENMPLFIVAPSGRRSLPPVSDVSRTRPAGCLWQSPRSRGTSSAKHLLPSETAGYFSRTFLVQSPLPPRSQTLSQHPSRKIGPAPGTRRFHCHASPCGRCSTGLPSPSRVPLLMPSATFSLALT